MPLTNLNLDITRPTQSQLDTNKSTLQPSASSSISDIGTFFNLPSIGDTNTAQARQDALLGATDVFGNVKRGPGSSAYDSVISTPAYTIGGVQYNAAGNPISGSSNITQTGGGGAGGGITGGGTGGTGGTGGSTGSSAALTDPLLRALESLGVARDTGRNSAQQEYNNMIKQYQDQFKIDQNRYGEQVNQNEQNLTGNRQAAMLQAAQGGQGLRAVLAAMGALNGTGSVLADRAITQSANKDIGDAQNNFETNASTLTSAWADTEAEKRKRDEQARTSLDNSFNNVDRNFFNNKIDILGKLANVYGADTSQGANYAREAGGLYDTAARLAPEKSVTYTPVSDLYNPQNLSKYLAGTNDLSVKTASGNSQPNSPSIIATPQKRKDELA